MTLHALLFDVDGTLADTERDGHRPAFNQAFADAGLDWHWDVALYGKLLAVTGGKERMKHYIDHFRPDYRKPDNFDELVAELHKAKTRIYSALAAQGGIPMRPGVKRLLVEARAAGLRLAIATTTTPENVTVLLEHSLGAGTQDWFEVIAAGDIVPAKKPAPDIYHYALEKMGLAAADCLAFEDSENGLRASLGAGLKTLVTVNDYTLDHDFTGAAVVLSDLGEPGAPNQRLAGAELSQPFVDVAYLRALHQG
ncbi:MAG: HAD family hydrolase [Thiobacillus sp.]|uniref:HAD family hydrolase n=1 Tax=unclassified Thiobacillus TaxID=2646513 RepID=UPI00086CD152|nr:MULTISPECIES: HAD family hydrolase [unclassified Thiobacillus]MBS0310178.1 HAD family hydrolase [Pseudomonadota bacterium]MBN8771769.1 HAD family hydrolase [Thiobacillus sp.]MBN8780168.1 HAD family hydrolase [Thiobacillus sp.]MBS0329571.1 HAD family hydrolase [Pseudomonadota bacterium]ODV02069.1 MAG: phosphatase [Thiobacillus sp. SCN 63-57]